ncbi:MAG: hypothetical protein ACFFG0_02860 [Candidatus Thorarchaeota archaeon]
MIREPEDYPIEFIDEHKIKLNCFEKGEHRGYDEFGLRCAMNNSDLLRVYVQWLEKYVKKYLALEVKEKAPEKEGKGGKE